MQADGDWVSRLGSDLCPTCVFHDCQENSVGPGRAERGTAVISAAEPRAVWGWCVWQDGEAGRGKVTCATAGEHLCPQQC